MPEKEPASRCIEIGIGAEAVSVVAASAVVTCEPLRDDWLNGARAGGGEFGLCAAVPGLTD